MMANRNLAHAVQMALIAASAAGASLYAGGAYAQEEELEQVVVTGSRIARPDLEAASPVTVVDRDSIVASGISDIGDLVQRTPSMSGSPIGTTTNNGGDGSVQIDLRGMGVDRTVTLVNGLRTVDGGDWQTIPGIMIERIEVLKNGASAVYGADAVAGVVNVLTRKTFDGVEVSAQTTDYFDMESGKQDTIGIILGKSFDGGGAFVFGAEYVDQNQALQSDAPWDFFQNTYYIYPEGCEKQVTAPYDGTPSGGCYVLGSSRIEEGRFAFLTQGSYMNEGNGLVPFDGRTYNYAPVNFIQTPYNKTNVFAEGSFPITDNVRAEAAFRGNFRESKQVLAPTPLDTGPFLDPGYPVVTSTGALRNGISADNYYLVQATTAAGLLPEAVTRVRRRMSEQDRSFTQDVTQFQFAASLLGDINEDYNWKLSYNAGWRDQTDKDFGQYSGSKLYNALGPSADLNGDGTPECYRNISDPTSLIAGCVPLNLFGGPNSVTPEMFNYINADLTDSQRTEMQQVEGSITGKAFELPGGDFSWALSGGYYRQEYTYSPDSLKSTFDVTGNKGEGTDGTLTAVSGGLELLAPVFDNGSQSLNLSGSVRYDSYNELDTSESTWQVGFDFAPIKNLRFRGTAGTVFRAPTISDLYAGRADNFPTFSDPCQFDPFPAGCAQQSVQPDAQVLTVVSGNPDLTPETGDTYTVGFVWTPDFGFTATVDYWSISLEDAISSYGIQSILDECYVNGNADLCANVTRDPASYQVLRVLDPTLNIAEQGAKGIDTELRYGFETGVGDFDFGIVWSHLLERTKTSFAGAPEEDLSGRFTDPTAQDGGAYAEDKANFQAQWNMGGVTLTYLAEYISSLDADTFCNCGTGNRPDGTYIQDIDSFLYHDVTASYDFGDGTLFGENALNGLKLQAGITNISDEEPPFIEVGFNATTDPSTYRMMGRGYFLRMQYKFE
jgi:iron complex outermembrane recepter protein